MTDGERESEGGRARQGGGKTKRSRRGVKEGGVKGS